MSQRPQGSTLIAPSSATPRRQPSDTCDVSFQPSAICRQLIAIFLVNEISTASEQPNDSPLLDVIGIHAAIRGVSLGCVRNALYKSTLFRLYTHLLTYLLTQLFD